MIYRDALLLYRDAILLYRDGLTGSGSSTATAILQNGDIHAFPWCFGDLPCLLNCLFTAS
jgi:hypothetical protein